MKSQEKGNNENKKVDKQENRGEINKNDGLSVNVINRNNDDNNKNSYAPYAQYIVTTAEPQHISGYKYTKDDDVNAAASALKIHWIAYIISIILFFTGIATLFTGIDRLYVFIRNAVIKYRMDNHLY